MELAHRAAKVWVEAGLAEHASVAAFSRFVLQLLRLAAPPELLRSAIRAMDDEVEHARLCFGVAKYLSGESAGPGPLDVRGALDFTDGIASIIDAVIVEGCLSETISARHAAVAAIRVQDPAIRSVLERIADDEARHSELSWRFLTWVLTAHPCLNGHVRTTFDIALAGQMDVGKDDQGGGLEAYGHLDAPSKQSVATQTIHELIRPRIGELLGIG